MKQAARASTHLGGGSLLRLALSRLQQSQQQQITSVHRNETQARGQRVKHEASCTRVHAPCRRQPLRLYPAFCNNNSNSKSQACTVTLQNSVLCDTNLLACLHAETQARGQRVKHEGKLHARPHTLAEAAFFALRSAVCNNHSNSKSQACTVTKHKHAVNA